MVRRSIALLLVLVCPGCATILATAAGPVTGGVDLVRETKAIEEQVLFAPFVFVGGVIAGPFLGFYAGINHDATAFHDFDRYQEEFHTVFRPFKSLDIDRYDEVELEELKRFRDNAAELAEEARTTRENLPSFAGP